MRFIARYKLLDGESFRLEDLEAADAKEALRMVKRNVYVEEVSENER